MKRKQGKGRKAKEQSFPKEIEEDNSSSLQHLKLSASDIEKALSILNKLVYEKYKNKEYAAAIVYCKRYIELNHTNAVIYNMLGYLYQKLAKYQNLDKQIKYFEKALEIEPDYKQTLRNLALAYPLVGRYQEASECFHKLFKLGPVMDDYMAYACLKIQLGDFEEGWKYYEYRFLKEYTPTEYPKIDKPRWEGQKISDKTLLVQCEQGFGDSIQFCRYLEQVKPLVKKIIFRVQKRLVDLMKNSLNDIEVVGISTPIEDLSFDYHIPIMSLPNVLKANINNIPLAEGYLKADRNKVETYKKEFFDNDCFKIGISWHGAKFGNVSRNIPLQCFYPLTKLENVSLTSLCRQGHAFCHSSEVPAVKVYSFQKGFGTEQLKKVPPEIEITDIGNTFKDFFDTAAAMENIDLFVTSDNSLFNLAGAMGKKTFVLLNKYSEWRWFFDEETTPWYESAKIFKKQDENDSWDLLMAKVTERLKEC